MYRPYAEVIERMDLHELVGLLAWLERDHEEAYEALREYLEEIL